MMVYVLSYILFYHFWLLSLRSVFFSNERQNGSRHSEVRGDGEELGGVEGRKAVFRSYWMRQNMLNKRGERN